MLGPTLRAQPVDERVRGSDRDGEGADRDALEKIVLAARGVRYDAVDTSGIRRAVLDAASSSMRMLADLRDPLRHRARRGGRDHAAAFQKDLSSRSSQRSARRRPHAVGPLSTAGDLVPPPASAVFPSDRQVSRGISRLCSVKARSRAVGDHMNKEIAGILPSTRTVDGHLTERDVDAYVKNIMDKLSEDLGRDVNRRAQIPTGKVRDVRGIPRSRPSGAVRSI